MAITHFGSVANPADNGVLTDGAARTITPPSSMVAGDLVVVDASVRIATETTTVSVTGGQTWNSLTNRTSGSISTRTFWCVFNGTWGADPAFETASLIGGAYTLVMSVFRPTSSSNTWSVDQAESWGTFTTSTALTITGQTPTDASSVTLAAWCTDADNNTFSGLTAGWSNAVGAQIRSTQSSGTTYARAYLIQTSAAATGNVTNTAAVSASGHRRIVTFSEAGTASGAASRVGGVPLKSLVGGALAH